MSLKPSTIAPILANKTITEALDKIVQLKSNMILLGGPERVVVGPGGTAVSSQRAAKGFNVKWDVVFIRDDGWTLGASHELAGVAQKMYSGKWLCMFSREEIIGYAKTKYGVADILNMERIAMGQSDGASAVLAAGDVKHTGAQGTVSGSIDEVRKAFSKGGGR